MMRTFTLLILAALVIAFTLFAQERQEKPKQEEQAVKPMRIKYTYGLLIDITTDDFVEQYRRSVKEGGPAFSREVVIRYKGKEVELTFEEFFKAVGLQP